MIGLVDVLARDAAMAAAQEIEPQARTPTEDHGIRCLVLDHDAMRGIEGGTTRLF